MLMTFVYALISLLLHIYSKIKCPNNRADLERLQRLSSQKSDPAIFLHICMSLVSNMFVVLFFLGPSSPSYRSSLSFPDQHFPP